MTIGKSNGFTALSIMILHLPSNDNIGKCGRITAAGDNQGLIGTASVEPHHDADRVKRRGKSSTKKRKTGSDFVE